MIKNDLREALNRIIKLHQPIDATDDDDQVIAVCDTCLLGPEFEHEGWPCATVTIAHKALNPQIPIADLRKDGLQRVRLEIARREDVDWVKGSDDPGLKVVS